MPTVYFSPGAWRFLQDAIAEGKLECVRSCLARATKTQGDGIVDCQDSDAAALIASLNREVSDNRARVQEMFEHNRMNEQWALNLVLATEAQRNLAEATGALVVEPSTHSTSARIRREYDEAYEIGF